MDPSAAPGEGVPVREAVRRYAALQPSLSGPTSRFVELVTGLLDEAGINYLSVTARTKTVDSFAAKAERRRMGWSAIRCKIHDVVFERKEEENKLGAKKEMKNEFAF